MNDRRIPLTFPLLLTLVLLNAAARPAPGQTTITVYGAAGRVSGSLAVLDTGNARWMVDCGACYPEEDDLGTDREERAARESATLPVAVGSIAGLVITHAHLDHLGRVPLLVDRGFQGPIYLTRPTALLAEPMLLMQVRFDRARVRTWAWSKASHEKSQETGRSLYVHWRHCPYRQAIEAENLETAVCSATELVQHLRGPPPIKPYLCQDCAKDEVAAVTRLFRPLEYDRPTAVSPDLTVTLLDAGHIPGSASVLFELATPEGTRRILFSGDLGNDLSALFAGPKPAPAADAVVLETTYGTTHRDPAVAGERARFRRAVAEVVASSGVAWIPAFSLDRTQKILYELRLAQVEGLLPESVPIYCPSPSAGAVTELYRRYQSSGWFRAEVAADPLAFSPREIRKTVPSTLPRPAILLSPSDMTTALWSERLLTKLLPDPAMCVLVVGYQDPQGEGGRLQRGAKELEILGRPVPVKARVQSFRCFSGHGDATDLDRWLEKISREAPLVLVHGGHEELKARASQLENGGWLRVVVARPGEPITPCDRSD